MISLGKALQMAAEKNMKNHYKMCSHCAVLYCDLTHPCTLDYKPYCFEVFLVSFLLKDTDQDKSQRCGGPNDFFLSHISQLFGKM